MLMQKGFNCPGLSLAGVIAALYRRLSEPRQWCFVMASEPSLTLMDLSP